MKGKCHNRGKGKHLMFYVFIELSSRFCPSLVGLAVSDGEEWRAITEMTVCKLVELSGMSATTVP